MLDRDGCFGDKTGREMRRPGRGMGMGESISNSDEVRPC